MEQQNRESQGPPQDLETLESEPIASCSSMRHGLTIEKGKPSSSLTAVSVSDGDSNVAELLPEEDGKLESALHGDEFNVASFLQQQLYQKEFQRLQLKQQEDIFRQQQEQHQQQQNLIFALQQQQQLLIQRQQQLQLQLHQQQQQLQHLQHHNERNQLQQDQPKQIQHHQNSPRSLLFSVRSRELNPIPSPGNFQVRFPIKTVILEANEANSVKVAASRLLEAPKLHFDLTFKCGPPSFVVSSGIAHALLNNAVQTTRFVPHSGHQFFHPLAVMRPPQPQLNASLPQGCTSQAHDLPRESQQESSTYEQSVVPQAQDASLNQGNASPLYAEVSEQEGTNASQGSGPSRDTSFPNEEEAGSQFYQVTSAKTVCIRGEDGKEDLSEISAKPKAAGYFHQLTVRITVPESSGSSKCSQPRGRPVSKRDTTEEPPEGFELVLLEQEVKRRAALQQDQDSMRLPDKSTGGPEEATLGTTQKGRVSSVSEDVTGYNLQTYEEYEGQTRFLDAPESREKVKSILLEVAHLRDSLLVGHLEYQHMALNPNALDRTEVLRQQLELLEKTVALGRLQAAFEGASWVQAENRRSRYVSPFQPRRFVFADPVHHGRTRLARTRGLSQWARRAEWLKFSEDFQPTPSLIEGWTWLRGFLRSVRHVRERPSKCPDTSPLHSFDTVICGTPSRFSSSPEHSLGLSAGRRPRSPPGPAPESTLEPEFTPELKPTQHLEFTLVLDSNSEPEFSSKPECTSELESTAELEFSPEPEFELFSEPELESSTEADSASEPSSNPEAFDKPHRLFSKAVQCVMQLDERIATNADRHQMESVVLVQDMVLDVIVKLEHLLQVRHRIVLLQREMEEMERRDNALTLSLAIRMLHVHRERHHIRVSKRITFPPREERHSWEDDSSCCCSSSDDLTDDDYDNDGDDNMDTIGMVLDAALLSGHHLSMKDPNNNNSDCNNNNVINSAAPMKRKPKLEEQISTQKVCSASERRKNKKGKKKTTRRRAAQDEERHDELRVTPMAHTPRPHLHECDDLPLTREEGRLRDLLEEQHRQMHELRAHFGLGPCCRRDRDDVHLEPPQQAMLDRMEERHRRRQLAQVIDISQELRLEKSAGVLDKQRAELLMFLTVMKVELRKSTIQLPHFCGRQGAQGGQGGQDAAVFGCRRVTTV